MSGGRLRIEVFPGGQIMPPFECFDAASKGIDIQAFMAAPVYWFGEGARDRVVRHHPFRHEPRGDEPSWYQQGGGLKLWEETYASFNLVPRQGPAFAPQMAGWFREKITTIDDYKGLKVRMGSNLGRKVVTKAGATAVLTPAADIYPRSSGA